jgi:hypothetical protein
MNQAENAARSEARRLLLVVVSLEFNVMADISPSDSPLAILEQAFVDEYLRGHGYTRDMLADLPRAAAERILAEAEEEASLLLAQIESRTHYLSALDERRFK